MSLDTGCFEYLHTPEHDSWLNLVEVVFFRVARTFLRLIRVGSLDELRRRILQGIDEMNAFSVPYRWKNSESLMSERVLICQWNELLDIGPFLLLKCTEGLVSVALKRFRMASAH